MMRIFLIKKWALLRKKAIRDPRLRHPRSDHPHLKKRIFQHASPLRKISLRLSRKSSMRRKTWRMRLTSLSKRRSLKRDALSRVVKPTRLIITRPRGSSLMTSRTYSHTWGLSTTSSVDLLKLLAQFPVWPTSWLINRDSSRILMTESSLQQYTLSLLTGTIFMKSRK